MKNQTKILSLVLALMIALSGLTAVPFTAAEAEPASVAAQADEEVLAPTGAPDSYTDISVGDTLTADIQNEGGKAYFRFIAPEDGKVRFSSSGSYDTYGYLYDEDMNELASNDDYDMNSNFMIILKGKWNIRKRESSLSKKPF